MDRAPRRKLLTTLEARVDPAHTAVLVVDMQNDYVAPGGATDQRGSSLAAARAIIEPTRQLLHAARTVGALVVYVQMTMDPQLLTVSDPEYQRRRTRWGDLPVVVNGTWGHEVIPELRPQTGDLCVEKYRSSGFAGTSLDLVLRTNHIRSTIVTGVVTNGCVNSTARGAVMHDYYVTVARDCVASSNQALHDASLMLLEHFLQLEESVVPVQRILDVWAGLPTGGSRSELSGAASR